MQHSELDSVDRGILHALQEDARNNSASDIADKVGVSPNTVRNRIEQLTERGVIRGYHPDIDYEAAGYQLHVNFIATVPITDRQETAEKALNTEGVIRVVERLSGRQNLAIETIGENREDITAIATRLEAIGCKIEEEWFLNNDRIRPFDHFRAVEDAEE